MFYRLHQCSSKLNCQPAIDPSTRPHTSRDLPLLNTLLQVAKPSEGVFFARSSKHYWGGCFWHVQISKEDGRNGECVGVYVLPSLSLSKKSVDAGKPALLLYGTKVRPGKEPAGMRSLVVAVEQLSS